MASITISSTSTAFDDMVAAHQFLEYAQVFGRSYGTPRGPVEAALADGQDILFDIDWQGFRQLRAALGGGCRRRVHQAAFARRTAPASDLARR